MATIASCKDAPINAAVLKEILRQIDPCTLAFIAQPTRYGKKLVPYIAPLNRVLRAPTALLPALILSEKFDSTTITHTDLIPRSDDLVSVGTLVKAIQPMSGSAYLGVPGMKGALKAGKLCNLYVFPALSGIMVMVLGDGFCGEEQYLEIVNRTNKILLKTLNE